MPLTDDSLANILRQFDKAKKDSQPWHDLYQEVSEHVAPSRATFQAHMSPATNRRRQILDGTGEEANEAMAAGLHGYLTSSAQRWFYLGISNKEVSPSVKVSRYLEDVMQVMYRVLNSPESHFQSQIDQVYLDLGLGTAAMRIDKDLQHGVTFSTKHMSSVFPVENPRGTIDTVYHEWEWQLRDVVTTYGADALPDTLRRAWEEGKTERMVKIVHAVLPRTNRDVTSSLARNMPFASLHIIPSDKHVLRESGYTEFPWAIPRWRVRTGETMGVGPGVRLINPIRMLQTMQETYLKSAQLRTLPPHFVRKDSLTGGGFRSVPGGIIPYSGDRAPEAMLSGDPGITREAIAIVQDEVRRGFFNDAFNVTGDSDGVNVKATFVMQRRDESIRRLAPVFARLESELLNKVVVRTFNILDEMGWLPEPPDELVDPLRVEYISPVARAMRTTEADDILRLLEMVIPMAEVDPGVLANIDFDQAARIAGIELYNVSPKIIRTETEVAAIRAQQKQEQEIQQAIEAAPALRDAAAASKDFQATP